MVCWDVCDSLIWIKGTPQRLDLDPELSLWWHHLLGYKLGKKFGVSWKSWPSDFTKSSFSFARKSTTQSFTFRLSLDWIWEMTSRGKIIVIEEKRKRAAFRTRKTMEFDPMPTILHSQEDVIEYLEKYHGPLPPCIEVEWCPRQISRSPL